MSFVHLHTHSEYSLLDGASRISDMIRTAVETGMPAMALTDHGVLYGAVDFYLQARAAGINPILGQEVYVAARSYTQKEGRADRDPHHLILLVKDLTGYRNLIMLSSIAHLEGYYYKPRIDKELLARHSEGLIALSSCLGGEVASRLLEGDAAAAEQAALDYRRIFGDDYFLEIQDHGLEEQARVNEGLAALARKTGIPLVATNDSHYTRQDDAEAHDILLCLQTGTVVSDPKRMRFHNDQFYLKSPAEMQERFRDFPEAVANTLRIAERCNLTLETRQLLPRFEVPSGHTAEGYLRTLVEAGLRRRYPAITPAVRDRFEMEFGVIEEMGYAAYFLIVSDFIEYARTHGVAVGPGRGSAAGSIVSYALGITTLDPLQHGLIFERFLNRERISMPDIDIDFDDRNRDRVIDYVAQRYGQDHVAQIITFGTMKARAVIRDVGRALDVPLRDVDHLAKLVPPQLNMTLEKAVQMVPELAAAEQDPAYARLLKNARKLEGLVRHASTHAAGIVIAPEPLHRVVPLQASITRGDRNGNGNGQVKRAVMTQYEMNAVQKIGLLKMDFLGLRNLSIIEDCLRNIEQTQARRLDLAEIPWDDPATFRLLQAGDTNGVFQLESPGLRRLLVDMRPTSFEDITAANGLFRPGPLEGGLVDQFVKRKHGEQEIVYPLPELEPILKETYGVIVYQEQVMQIASRLAGFSLGEADVLRAAMGKKKKEEMAKMRVKFIAGATQRGVTEAKATEIFDLMAFFAGYGFNKSHSASYAVLSYQTAYLKANYPLEYLAALLNNEAGNADRVAAAVLDCHARGIEVLPPDVNRSQAGFTVEDGRIRYGLAVIKNVGTHAVDLLIAARTAKGPFTSMLDLSVRVDPRELNKRVLESLVRSGATDCLGERGQLLASIDRVSDRAAQIIQERESGQTSLFGMLPEANELDDPRVGLVEGVPPMPQDERLRGEKELLGLYVSDHPLRQIEQALHARVDTYANEITPEMENLEVRVGGMIKAIRPVITRSGKAMAFVQLEDLTSTIEVIVFPRVYEERRLLLEPDRVVIVRGKVDARAAGGGTAEDEERTETPKVLADDVMAFDDRDQNGWTRNQVVHLDVPAESAPDQLARLEEALRACPGPDRVVLHLQREDGVADMELGERFRVQGGGPAGERAQREINAIFGRPVWRVEVIRRKAPERQPNGRQRQLASSPV
ncbi:MAG TPA: DNA polymerase III subunit alpha [Candidatus Limnocylindrales bacterium]|nr:DNA polymerase III subunit alpha [Candidatus Limnocylindrales bacterium]